MAYFSPVVQQINLKKI